MGGDLRKLHHDAGSDTDKVSELLQSVKGVGPAGAAIFLREAQTVWSDLRPFADDLTLKGAKQLGLGMSPEKLAGQVSANNFPRLVAECVRAALDQQVRAEMVEALG